MCFWRQLPVARSCWHSCSVWADPAVSTRLCYNGWGSDGQEEAGLWVCDSAFPCGFSHNKYRPLRVESFFSPFRSAKWGFYCLAGHGDGVGGFLHLWNPLSGAGRLCSAVIFVCATSLLLSLGSLSKCVSYSGLIFVSAPLIHPVGIAPQLFTAITYVGSWVSAGLHWALSLSFPFSIPPLLLA